MLFLLSRNHFGLSVRQEEKNGVLYEYFFSNTYVLVSAVGCAEARDRPTLQRMSFRLEKLLPVERCFLDATRSIDIKTHENNSLLEAETQGQCSFLRQCTLLCSLSCILSLS